MKRIVCLNDLPQLPAHRFTTESHGNGKPYPFVEAGPPFLKKLDRGFKVVGWARNEALAPAVRRSDDGGPYLAVMFHDADGFSDWCHMGDYPYQFIES